MFGNGVCTYITSSITSGSPSWPRRTPVENVHATLRSFTFSVLISLTELYRVADGFLLGIVQSSSAPAAPAADDAGDGGGAALLQAATPDATNATTMNSAGNLFI